jgi:hypothetical protein
MDPGDFSNLPGSTSSGCGYIDEKSKHGEVALVRRSPALDKSWTSWVAYWSKFNPDYQSGNVDLWDNGRKEPIKG